MTIRIPGHLRELTPYVPGTPIEDVERELGISDAVKLASNENPLGPSPRAVAAIRDAAVRAHRYPDGSGRALREALAARHGVSMAEVVLGNGSTELVELLAKTFLVGGAGAVMADQAFIVYRTAVRAMSAPLTIVPLRDHRHDLDAMASACTSTTALVYIANPNNPTGTCVTRAAMERFLDRLPGHVLAILDEAYLDYVDGADCAEGIGFFREGRNLVLLRTFSKIHGLAGMRIGFALAPREVAGALDLVRSPFNTSITAQAAALAALDDSGHIERSRAENAAGVRHLQDQLRRRSIEFVPTVANFVLIRTRLPGLDLYRKLLRQGVIVRPMEVYGYPDGVRVSVGTREEIDRFLSALDRSLRSESGPGGTVGDP